MFVGVTRFDVAIRSGSQVNKGVKSRTDDGVDVLQVTPETGDVSPRSDGSWTAWAFAGELIAEALPDGRRGQPAVH